jgi:hypothetical protein
MLKPTAACSVASPSPWQGRRCGALPIAADVSHVAAAELVVERDIEEEVGVAAVIDALEHQVALSSLPILFLDGRDVAPLRRDHSLAADGLHRRRRGWRRMASRAALELPVFFLQEWMWSPSMTWRPQAQIRRSL